MASNNVKVGFMASSDIDIGFYGRGRGASNLYHP